MASPSAMGKRREQVVASIREIRERLLVRAGIELESLKRPTTTDKELRLVRELEDTLVALQALDSVGKEQDEKPETSRRGPGRPRIN